MNNKKKTVTFKFSLNTDKHSDLIIYLQNIKSKTKRGEWITNAVKIYKKLENALKTVDTEEIENFVETCIKNHTLKNKP